jgi:ABC-type phosphate transport system substrate-binding protein
VITRSKRLGAAALGCAAMAVAIGAPTAGASFKPPYNTKCAGSNISGVGSTFQNTLQTVWAANWVAASCSAGLAPSVTYNAAGIPNGSGAGLAAMGATDAAATPRSTTFAFAGSDDAPTPLQITNANEGTNVVAGADADDAQLRTIPVAAGAIAMIVNYPDHCILPTGFTYTKTSGPAGNTRLALSRGRMERMWRGGTGNTKWSDIVAGIDDDNTVDHDPATNQCANVPIVRVVRKDVSGSSLTLKRWLDVQRAATNWVNGFTNLQWPNDNGDNTTSLVRPDGTGGGQVAAKVNAIDGSVGYVDLATARGAGFDLAPGTDDTTYWLPVQDQNSSFQDPQYFHYAQITNSAYQAFYGTPVKKGANCRSTLFSGVPDPNGNGKDADDSFASWQDVNGVASGSNGGYPICLLTYDLAWDDALKAFPTSPLPPTTPRPVEAAQRTVRDYLVYGTSLSGMTQANTNDYAQLPEDIRSLISSPAAAALSFNK